ncbi:MAG TPA: hypothetical protein VGM88_08850 [Kofleriaceae bacterium]|jgi:hypothetical protein
MSLARQLAVLAVLVGFVGTAHAKKHPKADDDDDETTSDDDSSSDDASDEKPAPKKHKKHASDDDAVDEQGPSQQDDDFAKQDLSGHDIRTKKSNEFEKDRFVVDKVDDEKTAKGTLIQGSLTWSSFAYHESASRDLASTPSGDVPAASQFNRLFTELRLQTDFRHISGGDWDGRIDVRGRMTNDPTVMTDPAYSSVSDANIQSGFLGKNELDLKELWLLRNGKRSDVFFGRQFIPDLAGVKIDGLRVDYASSSKWTYLGFAGLYPIRGSRSLSTDYEETYGNPETDGTRAKEGRFTGAAGFGAAYRTQSSYGSFGGVALVPFGGEQPRIFGTSTGYWRVGPKLDFYHFAVVDLIGSNAVNYGMTNLSLGLNWKPDPRLRGTLSFNRNDTETLNVQAQAFLSDQYPGYNFVVDEAVLTRIAQNEARASLSAGLGPLQRFEVTAAGTVRYRSEITITPPGDGTAVLDLPGAKSFEIYGSFTDRDSFKHLRLGIDFSKIIGIGDDTYQRTEVTGARVFGAHDIRDGRGEVEAEIAYSSTHDDDAGKSCNAGGSILDCFGSANGTILSIGGTLYYRLSHDWFGLVSLYYNHTHLQVTDPVTTGMHYDPPITGLTGYLRISYRF